MTIRGFHCAKHGSVFCITLWIVHGILGIAVVPKVCVYMYIIYSTCSWTMLSSCKPENSNMEAARSTNLTRFSYLIFPVHACTHTENTAGSRDPSGAWVSVSHSSRGQLLARHSYLLHVYSHMAGEPCRTMLSTICALHKEILRCTAKSANPSSAQQNCRMIWFRVLHITYNKCLCSRCCFEMTPYCLHVYAV